LLWISLTIATPKAATDNVPINAAMSKFRFMFIPPKLLFLLVIPMQSKKEFIRSLHVFYHIYIKISIVTPATTEIKYNIPNIFKFSFKLSFTLNNTSIPTPEPIKSPAIIEPKLITLLK